MPFSGGTLAVVIGERRASTRGGPRVRSGVDQISLKPLTETWIPASGQLPPLEAARSYGCARSWRRSRHTYEPTLPAWSTMPGATCSGQRISTAVIESMVNRVIGRRMAKKQPMRPEPARRPPAGSNPGGRALRRALATTLPTRVPALPPPKTTPRFLPVSPFCGRCAPARP
jgi:hypothetical protein